MKTSFHTLVSALVAVAALSGIAIALQEKPAAPAPAAPAAAAPAKDEVIVPFLGNATCPTQAGKKVNPSKYVELEQQRVYFCCGKCAKAAEADPKAAIAAAYKEAAKPVANKKCPVSGHAIDAAKAKSVAFMGHSISLCCAQCEEAFKKDAYVMAVCAIYGAEDLKNAKCPSMDEEIKEVSDMVIYKGKLVRLCCADCVAEFKKDADKMLAKASAK
jgi:hypothetical protein